MPVSSLVRMAMTMWHLQVHQCEDQLQELEMSSQQLLQASAEQVSSHCECFSGRTKCGIHCGWLWPALALIQSLTVPLILACLPVLHPQAQSQISIRFTELTKMSQMGRWCCMSFMVQPL